MTAFLALVRKDLQIFFGDTRAVIMAFAAPILIGSFFGYVFGGNQSRGWWPNNCWRRCSRTPTWK